MNVFRAQEKQVPVSSTGIRKSTSTGVQSPIASETDAAREERGDVVDGLIERSPV